MARDKDRYSKDQRFEVVLDNGEDVSRWSDLLGNASTLVSGTEHVTGSRSVSFNKTAGISADAYIVRPLDVRIGMDLDAFSSEGQILSSVYLSSTTDVASYQVALLMSSGTSDGAFYSVSDADLSVGWNHLKMDCASYTTASGCGVDWNKVKWLGVGVSFDSASDTLSDILVDSVRINVPTSTFKFDPNIGNISVTAGTEIAIKNGDAADELSVDAANTARSTSTNVIPVQHIDAEGKVLKSGADSDSPVYTQDVGGGSGGGGGSMLYMSPEDFVAVYSTASGIILSGMSFTPAVEQFVGVTQFNVAGLAASFTPSTNGFDYDSSTGALNLGGTPTFADADKGYRVQVYGPDKAFARPFDATKIVDLKPLSEQYVLEEVADVSNETDDSSMYYAAFDGYKTCIVQFKQSGGTDAISVKVSASVEDVVAASATYLDITEHGLDSLVSTSTSGSLDDEALVKTQDGSTYKWLRFEAVRAGVADDADYKLWIKKVW